MTQPIRFGLFLGLLSLAFATPNRAEEYLSEASRRAIERGYDTIGTEFLVTFKESPLKGDLAYDPKIIRRDPSAVIRVDGLYHVWYTYGEATKVVGYGGAPEDKVYPWDLTDVWHATSEDGWTWKEVGLAVGRGPAGSYDDRAVFTPEILKHDGRYYMVYQVVKAPYLSRTKNEVGMAIADSPYGPWKKLDKPIFSPSDTGKWKGEINDRTLFAERGDFDSYKVHDPTLIHYDGEFRLYYKGQGIGQAFNIGGREIKHGVAIAEKPEGPYVRSPYNPISNSGHEIAVWPYRGGLACLLTTDGPERNTIQWSPDGINFSIKAHLKHPPVALGIYRSENPEENDTLPAGLPWGLAHKYKDWSGNYLTRYEVSRPVMRDPGFKNRGNK